MEVKDIADAALTVLIGAYCLMAVQLFLYIFDLQRVRFAEDGSHNDIGVGDNGSHNDIGVGDDDSQPAKGAVGRFNKGVVGVVFLLSSFALGLIVEDLSYNFVDDSKPYPGLLETVLGPLVGHDSLRTLLRVQVLIEMPPVGRELAQLNLFTELEIAQADVVERWLLGDPCISLDSPPYVLFGSPLVACKGPIVLTSSDRDVIGSQFYRPPARWSCLPAPNLREMLRLPSRSDPYVLTSAELDEVIARFYYNAKNWTYRQPTYFNELQRIQSRVDFSRTLALTSLVLLLAYCLVALVYGVSADLHDYDIVWLRWWKPRRRHLKIGLAILIYVLAMVGGLIAYRHESKEFAKRSFGYYGTGRHLDKLNHSGAKQLSRDDGD
jgi:hypothetical protein